MQNIAKNKQRDFIEIFSSIADFISALETRDVNPAFENRAPQSAATGERAEKFTGTPDFETAARLMQTGDFKAAKKIKPARATLRSIEATIGETRRPKMHRATAGARPIVPLAILNQPDAMLTIQRNKNNGRVINLYYNAVIDKYVKANEAQRVASNMLAAIAGAEAAGVRVNLFVGVISCDYKRGGILSQVIGFFVNVKKSTAPLNTPLLAYSMTHPSLPRRHAFKYTETTPAKLNPEGLFPRTYGCAVSDAHKFVTFPPDSVSLSFYDIRHDESAEILKRILERETM